MGPRGQGMMPGYGNMHARSTSNSRGRFPSNRSAQGQAQGATGLQARGGARAGVPNKGPQRMTYSASAALPADRQSASGASATAPAAADGKTEGSVPLDMKALSDANADEQKQILGEALFPMVFKQQPEQAGKITGMLLEIDNAEIVHMIESQESLKAKIDEAVEVLKAHQQPASPEVASEA